MATDKTPSLIATLATGPAIGDLKLLLKSLAFWNSESPPAIYIFCDMEIAAALPSLKYPGPIFHTVALDGYTHYNRQQMEQLPSSEYPNLWFEFMAQKLNLLEWVFETAGAAAAGVLFCDADICFFGPLPKIPAAAQVALSQHGIRSRDEARYGKYNGGFLWFSDPSWIGSWRAACRTEPRFFEQAALEVVAAAAAATAPESLYLFPRAHNYGWWRLWQGEASPEIVQREWAMNRAQCPAASGIMIGKEALNSVHTHFLEERDHAVVSYNTWVLSWLQKLAPAHPPSKRFLQLLQSCGIKIERK